MNKSHRDLIASIQKAIRSNTVLLESIAKLGESVTVRIDPVVHVSVGRESVSVPKPLKGTRTPKKPRRVVKVSLKASPTLIATRARSQENYITRTRHRQIHLLAKKGNTPSQIVEALKKLGYLHISEARVNRVLASNIYRYNL